MLAVTLKRKNCLTATGEIHRDRIVNITINRAIRIEAIFFTCQGIRLVHTFIEIWREHRCNDVLAIIERSSVTVLLVVASLWDLHSRTLIKRELDILHPDTPPSQLA